MSKKPPKVFQAPFKIFDMLVGYHCVCFGAKIGISYLIQVIHYFCHDTRLGCDFVFSDSGVLGIIVPVLI